MAWVNIPTVGADDPIVIEWGNAVAADMNTELIRRDGAVAMTGPLLLVNTSPTLDNHAVRKKYADDTYLRLAGDTMTGALDLNPSTTSQVLKMRSQLTGTGGVLTNTPQLAFYDATGAVRYGYIQGSAANLAITTATGAILLNPGGAFTVNSGAAVTLNSGAAGDIVLNSSGGQVRTTDAIFSTGASRFYGSAMNLCNAGSSVHLDFYAAASNVDSIGTRNGWIGYSGGASLSITNETAVGSILYLSNFAHAFSISGTEAARLIAAGLLVGKNVSDPDVVGVELLGPAAASGTRGTIRSTVNAAGTPNMYCRRIAPAAADGQIFIDFTTGTGAGTRVGRIEQVGTSGAAMVSGSDYRLKDDLGPITDAVERVRLLQPKRMRFKTDPPEAVFDGFIAHEVTPAAPYAVRGEKDAVLPPDDPYDPGGIDAQGLVRDAIVPLLTAALQDALDEIDTLKTRVAALEAA